MCLPEGLVHPYGCVLLSVIYSSLPFGVPWTSSVGVTPNRVGEPGVLLMGCQSLSPPPPGYVEEEEEEEVEVVGD